MIEEREETTKQTQDAWDKQLQIETDAERDDHDDDEAWQNELENVAEERKQEVSSR